MDDLISRKTAIDLWDKYHPCIATEAMAYDRELRALPSVQPEQRWIPVKTRPMDEEEKQYWEENYGYTFGEDFDGIIFDCPMPVDGQEVWVCSIHGTVWQDTCDVDEGIGLEENGDWDDIVAWMPFERPEPWKGDQG